MAQPHKDEVFERWWPLPRSLDLVRAPFEQVAQMLEKELDRVVPDEPKEAAFIPAASLNAFFLATNELTNFPTALYALPTKTSWTVLWTNGFLCDGYDSLCYNLSRLYSIETLHWHASDTDGPFQAGSGFTHRPGGVGDDGVRVVQCHRNDTKWRFLQRGTPLPSEPVAGYENRLKRERLNEHVMVTFLASLGAEPWREAFYDFPARPFFKVWRTSPPATITARPVSQVVTGQRR